MVFEMAPEIVSDDDSMEVSVKINLCYDLQTEIFKNQNNKAKRNHRRLLDL